MGRMLIATWKMSLFQSGKKLRKKPFRVDRCNPDVTCLTLEKKKKQKREREIDGYIVPLSETMTRPVWVTGDYSPRKTNTRLHCRKSSLRNALAGMTVPRGR